MTAGVAELLAQVAPPATAGAYHVLPLEDVSGYYAARDSLDRPALLIRTDHAAGVPIRVAGIEVRFGVSCELAEPGCALRTETITVVQCLSDAKDVESYFAFCADGLALQLGPDPKAAAIRSAVAMLVELFQSLRKPAARALVGLVGELSLLLTARAPARAINAWRVDPTETFDFVSGDLRMDAKASSHRQRTHSVSLDQVNPPQGTTGLFASIWVEPAAGGMSVRELIRQIERRVIADHNALARVRSIVAASLGETAPTAMDWSFDAALAKTSTRFFLANSVPTLPLPLPPGVASVRFTSNFDFGSAVTVAQLAQQLQGVELDLLPGG